MTRIWNYLFYSTWKTQIDFGRKFIQEPFFFLMFKLFPSLRKNERKGLKEFNKLFNNKDSGANLGFAFAYMNFSTMIVYFCVSIYLGKILDIVIVRSTVSYYFFGVILVSYLTNQLLIYRGDTYKKYFNEFEKVSNKSQFYFSAVLFHVVVFTFGILKIFFGWF